MQKQYEDALIVVTAQMLFIGTQCPGCRHIWNETDDLLHAMSAGNDEPQAWHEECLRKARPELFTESEVRIWN